MRPCSTGTRAASIIAVRALPFVPPEQQLDPAAEKAEYDLHENSLDDPGYRRFLGRLCDPLMARLPPGAGGLDFGCGPGPALSAMLEERGHPMALYDIYYRPDKMVLERRYDFITATEVVEHLAAPGRELERLWSLLVPGGWLGIMTKLALDRNRFAAWHYKNDPTHISFFSRESFLWLGGRWGVSPVFVAADTVLLQKPDDAPRTGL